MLERNVGGKEGMMLLVMQDLLSLFLPSLFSLDSSPGPLFSLPLLLSRKRLLN